MLGFSQELDSCCPPGQLAVWLQMDKVQSCSSQQGAEVAV